MMRLLITGGGGYLGRHLVPAALQSAANAAVCYTFHQRDPLQLPQGQRLDVRDGAAVHHLVSSFQPDVIIHTAGSNRSADMTSVIEMGARHVAAAAAAVDARLIHLSTDSVFKGDVPPYDETAAPSPVNEYGRAKAAAETIVRRYDNHVIIRTSLVYGLRLMDHGTAWMAEALRHGRPVTLFSNQYRNPIWVDSLCRACLELADHPYTGILNVAGRQVLSRADFALRLLDWWQVSKRETLTIGASEGDVWPLDCRLDLRRATAVLATPLWGVDEVLDWAATSR
jgi:dTDP-4-dehydrorhamnose reductase